MREPNNSVIYKLISRGAMVAASDDEEVRMSEARLTAEEIAARTPDGRNRYADALRLLSIVVVVYGHWLLAVISVQDAQLEAANLLTIEPWTHWLTWIFQVMPLFFLVGIDQGGDLCIRRVDQALEIGHMAREAVPHRRVRQRHPMALGHDLDAMRALVNARTRLKNGFGRSDAPNNVGSRDRDAPLPRIAGCC
jgi:hypothetical protein